MASWRRLLLHCVRAADSRTFCTAGTSSAIKIAMMAITTSNSMRVNPPWPLDVPDLMGASFGEELMDNSFHGHGPIRLLDQFKVELACLRILHDVDLQDRFPRIAVLLGNQRFGSGRGVGR